MILSNSKKNEKTKKTEQKFRMLPLIAYSKQAALSTEAFGSTYEERRWWCWWLVPGWPEQK